MKESKIIRLFSTEPRRAFSIIVKNHQQQLYWYIRRMVLSHEDADDILQNTFLKAWKGFKNFKGASSISTWLHTIARNETYTFLEKRKKLKHAGLVEEVLRNEKAAGYFSGETADILLQQAIDELPTRQKEVFILKYYQEMPYLEIKEVLGGSVGSHKASYHHAVKKIEDFLKKALNHDAKFQSNR